MFSWTFLCFCCWLKKKNNIKYEEKKNDNNRGKLGLSLPVSSLLFFEYEINNLLNEKLIHFDKTIISKQKYLDKT